MVTVGTSNSRLTAFVILGVLQFGTAQVTHAFDFFGLFGEKPPAVTAQAVAYQLDIQG